jgi:zinc and cadmium transporter
MVLELIIAATLIVSAASLAGILFLSMNQKRLNELLPLLVSLSGGTLLGAAFLDLIPESLEGIEIQSAMLAALVGFIAFFILEKMIMWHHHHSSKHSSKVKPLGYLNLIGDGLHNFFDGIAISAAFISSPALGMTTTIAVILHEIPQEIGDFSLLLYSGMEKTRALAFNFLSALTAVVGAVSFYYIAPFVAHLSFYGLAFTAGMFIYIASADVVPELHKDVRPKESVKQLALMLLGIAIIAAAVTFLERAA